jgi:hypothetical protein
MRDVRGLPQLSNREVLNRLRLASNDAGYFLALDEHDNYDATSEEVSKWYEELSLRLTDLDRLRERNAQLERVREAANHLVQDRAGMTYRASMDAAVVSHRRLLDVEATLAACPPPEG